MGLRRAQAADLDRVAELEQCFAMPLSREELDKVAQNDLFHVMIWEINGAICGHCILYRVCDEAEITSFSVDAALRGQGIGTEFLTELLRYLKADGAKIAYLEVRESNLAAQRLYEKCGFTVIGRRKRFYEKPVEDALAMGIELA
ncbi:MAG: ribosomal protein S18-alanine N-acetyltransferase [Clostridia bacterium]|nr:ribosomal protein S18-alanine N-acetyltransferase [Clostridia bacterium]